MKRTTRLAPPPRSSLISLACLQDKRLDHNPCVSPLRSTLYPKEEVRRYSRSWRTAFFPRAKVSEIMRESFTGLRSIRCLGTHAVRLISLLTRRPKVRGKCLLTSPNSPPSIQPLSMKVLAAIFRTLALCFKLSIAHPLFLFRDAESHVFGVCGYRGCYAPCEDLARLIALNSRRYA